MDADIGGSSQRHRAQDLEIEQRYANLLTPIRDLTKNWEVDISAYLDQYLEEVSWLASPESLLQGGPDNLQPT